MTFWSLPAARWVMVQRWENLLFAHWPVDARTFEALVPPPLTLDTFEGTAWLAVTPFRVSHVRLRGLPPMPWGSSFPEINVRTYVSVGGIPGVYFFSLDAGSALAVAGGRRWYGLPYVRADFTVQARDGRVAYACRRRPGEGAPPAEIDAEYGPSGPVTLAAPGSLAWWLTERYCLYTVDGDDVNRAEIHHVPWPLQPATALIRRNTMAAPLGIDLSSAPSLLHFAASLDVMVRRSVNIGGPRRAPQAPRGRPAPGNRGRDSID